MDKGFEEAKPIIETLKSKGASSVGAAGFYWGGKVVVELSKVELIQAVVILHSTWVTVDDIKGVKVPIAVLGAEIDHIAPPELLKQYDEALTSQSKFEITRSTDVVIVGAGVAGVALAYTLGKEGRQVRVIERDLSEPDRIFGELLQPGSYLKLIELGLEGCVNEIDAQKVFGYALHKDGINTKLSYPLEKFNADVARRGFHNGRFVQRLREKVASLPKYSSFHFELIFLGVNLVSYF